MSGALTSDDPSALPPMQAGHWRRQSAQSLQGRASLHEFNCASSLGQHARLLWDPFLAYTRFQQVTRIMNYSTAQQPLQATRIMICSHGTAAPFSL